MKIGLIGAGSIAESILDSIALIPEMHVSSMGATPNGRAKLEAFAERYSTDAIYCNCMELIKTSDADCIYVAAPNHLHYQYVKSALETGKHVICEKPFCSNAEELTELIELARSKKLFLFEAISNQYYPNYRKVKQLLPELGDIKIVEMNYSQYSKRYASFKNGDAHNVFDVTKSGGALMDLNVYNIHFIVGLFGAPQSVRYYANLMRGVDTSGTLILEYSDFVCSATAAKDCAAPSRISIQGDEGCIYSSSPSNVFAEFAIKRNGQDEERFALNGEGTITERLVHEYKAFLKMYEARDWKSCEAYLEQSLAVQNVLDEARNDAGIHIISHKG